MNNEKGPRRRGIVSLSDLKKIDKNTLKRLLSYIFKEYKIRFIIVFILILISSIASVATSLFLEKLIDDYITPLIGIDNPVWTPLLKTISFMVVIYIIGIISTYIYNRIIAIISQGVLKDIRDEMFSKMQRLPINYFDTHTYGEIMSYYTNDTDTLREMISRSIPQILSSLTTIITALIAMICTSIYLTLLVFIFVGIMIFVTSKMSKKSGNYFMLQQKSLAKMNGYIEEMINGSKVIKVFNYEDDAKREFDILNEDLYLNATRANQFANSLFPLLGNIGNMEYAFVGIVGGYLAISNIGGLTLGTIAAFIGLSKNFLMPISHLSQQFNSIIMAMAGATRIFNLMDELPETDDGDITLVNVKYENGKYKEVDYNTNSWAWKDNKKYIPLAGKIDFIEVNFGYTPSKEVLHDVSLYAKPGQKISFVGATGAGKTTITNLINRFYDINFGEILYDGINIKRIKKSSLRKSLGMVLQDVNLFTGTIKDNIRYGNKTASDEEVIAASKLANAHDFIMHLPNGYDTIIDGAGSNLSGGQKQLLCIARAAINNPPVMILDEATSSIDTRTERLVQNGMDKLMDGRTVLVIAHRLSTIQNSKAIMVMDKGRIIERGEHDYLISLKGEYYELYTGKVELE